MKKLLIILLITAFTTVAYAQSDSEEYPKNVGYKKSLGMVGGYLNLPDFVQDDYKDYSPRGGAMIYFNVLNKIWGNVALGISSEYIGTEFNGYVNGFNVDSDIVVIPTTFNVAYMTSSRLINAWAGLGVSYAYFKYDIKNGSYNSTTFGKQESVSGSTYGVDGFAGVEYMFTDSGNIGLFFEFRYSLLDVGRVSQQISGISQTYKHNLTLDRFRYSIGVAYHF